MPGDLFHKDCMTSDMVIVEKGSISAYRLFDVGSEIILNQVMSVLNAGDMHRYTLRKKKTSFVISDAPVVVTLAPWRLTIEGETFDIRVQAKLWSFGTISIRCTLDLRSEKTIEQLSSIGYFLANDAEFHQEVVRRAVLLSEDLKTTIRKPAIWGQYEDYLIFDIRQVRGVQGDLKQAFYGNDITSLILTEKKMNFASDVNFSIAKNIIQYGADDLVLMHWNSAIIFNPEDAVLIADTIEFALSQQLEMRYYDSLLDDQLRALYHSIEHRPASVFSNPYYALSRQAALQYIEISEVVDRIVNSLKVVQDHYYATIYRMAMDHMRIQDWRKSVDQKLENLADFSKLFQGEINEKRNLVLEAIIVILITIEVVPLVYRLITG